MTRAWLRISFSLATLTTIAVPGCGKDDSNGSGTESDSDASDTSMTAATMSTSSTMSTGASEDSGTSNDPDTTASSVDESSGSETDTGELPCPYTPVDGMPAVGLQLVASGFDRPVLALGHPTEPDRLFVVEQGGAVRIVEPGESTAPADAFLQLDVSCGGNGTIGCERGLLGFAFHPDFPDDPRVYASYSPAASAAEYPPTRVSEFTVAQGDVVDMTSERIVIEASQPAGNHNGGMIAFGPDGYLYFGLGDGGNGDDQPQQTGRNTSVILAKILRIDVEPDDMPDMPVSCELDDCADNGPFDYTIPADNPFVGMEGYAPEIWAWGFRNPWRFSFDPATGDLYAGDVGQDQVEEIDVVTKGGDYGWSTMEGNNCFQGAECDTSAAPGATNGDGMTTPIIEYSHNDGCSVTGGGVYRSCEVPAWDGLYFYGDYCAGNLAALVWDGSSVDDLGDVLDIGELPLGNGWNAYGDVFITTVDAVPNGPISDGLVYRIAPQ